MGDGVFAEDGDLAGGSARETLDDFQRGGFAGAIGAEQSVDLAAVDVEVEIIHCLKLSFSSFVGLVQVVHLQDLL